MVCSCFLLNEFWNLNQYFLNFFLIGLTDLFENFFIRILRGSGLKGLTSFDEKSKIYNKNLLRPLLSQNKEDLVYLSNYIVN